MPSHWGFWKLLGPQTCWRSLLLPRHLSSQKQEGSSSGYADLEREPKQRAFWGRKLGFGFSTEQCGIGKALWDLLRRRGTMRSIDGGSIKFLHTVKSLFQNPRKLVSETVCYLSSVSLISMPIKSGPNFMSLSRKGKWSAKVHVDVTVLTRMSDESFSCTTHGNCIH